MNRLPALIVWLGLCALAGLDRSAAFGAPPTAILLGTHDDRLSPPEFYRYRDLLHGRRPLQDADTAETKHNRAIMQKAARWYVYRLTWPDYQNGRGELGMSDVVQDACRQFPLASARRPLTAEQVLFQQHFGAELRERLQDVLRDRQPIVRINAARIVAHLAAAGQIPAGELLLTMIQDARESDAVRLYAFRGLKDLFDLAAPDAQAAAVEKLRQAAVPVLLDYVRRPAPLAAGAPADEIDGYRYVRREAVRAVIAARPADPRANDKLDRASVAVLVGLLGKDSYRPGPSLSEQLEAAVALCALQPTSYEPAELELAAHQAAGFVVELARHVQLAAGDRSPAHLPWKTAAVRLSVALAALHERFAATPLADKTAPLVDEAQVVLTQIEKGEAPLPAELSRWLQQHPPPPSDLSRQASPITLAAPAPQRP